MAWSAVVPASQGVAEEIENSDKNIQKEVILILSIEGSIIPPNLHGIGR